MKKYAKEFEVHYYEINKYKEAAPVAILNYLEEAAVAHSESVGMGMDVLKSQGNGWVLNRWFLEMNEYPLWNEKIVVDTWPSSFEKFYATREFEIRDSRNKIIGRASSLWIYLNIEKKRPSRIPDEIGNAYEVNAERTVDRPFYQFDNLIQPEITKKFQVRQSDIDTNNHVNNTRFVEWVLEAVPQDIYSDFFLKQLEVLYKKEVVYGSEILSGCMRMEECDSDYCYMHSIAGDDGSEAAVARTMWEKRQ